TATQGRPRVPRPGPRAGRQGPGDNPGRTANKAREHLRAILSWAWEQELIEAPPRFPGPGDPRDVAGRHYLTKPEINALDFATYKMGRPLRLVRAAGRRPVLASRPGRVLQLRCRHRDRLEVRSGSRTDPLAPCDLGSSFAGPGGQGAVALGVAV